MRYPETISKLTTEISKLPGIGEKSAKRIVFHLFSKNPELIGSLAQSLKKAENSLRSCEVCFALTDTEECEVCGRQRDPEQICVVEDAQNIYSIESGGVYRGLYHVLQGLLSPMRGIHPENLRIRELVRRIEDQPCSELILALNPTLEGEATSYYITDLLKEKVGKITKLAVGMPSGGDLEYSDAKTLAQAFENRLSFH